MNRRKIIFKAVARHEAEIKPYQRSFNFFGDSELDEESVLELEEKEIVSWIFQQKEIIPLIINEFLEDYIIKLGYSCHLEIKDPVLNKSDQKRIGDIDILIIPFGRSDLTTVIEVKRVKLKTLENGKVKINKLDRAKSKGYKQAKELFKLKFHRTILCILIEDDARVVKSIGTLVRASESEEVEWIYSISFDEKLPKEVGVGYIIVNQPTGESFNKRFNLKYLLEKRPISVEQEIEQTNRINDFFD